MRNKARLKRAVILIVIALLICASSGCAIEYDQGKGEVTIGLDFMDYSVAYILVMLSDGSVELHAYSEPTDSGRVTDVSASADGSYNSVRESIIWLDGSVSSNAYSETDDITTTESLQVEETGTYSNSVTSDNSIDHRRQIIMLHNDGETGDIATQESLEAEETGLFNSDLDSDYESYLKRRQIIILHDIEGAEQLLYYLP